MPSYSITLPTGGHTLACLLRDFLADASTSFTQPVYASAVDDYNNTSVRIMAATKEDVQNALRAAQKLLLEWKTCLQDNHGIVIMPRIETEPMDGPLPSEQDMCTCP